MEPQLALWSSLSSTLNSFIWRFLFFWYEQMTRFAASSCCHSALPLASSVSWGQLPWPISDLEPQVCHKLCDTSWTMLSTILRIKKCKIEMSWILKAPMTDIGPWVMSSGWFRFDTSRTMSNQHNIDRLLAPYRIIINTKTITTINPLWYKIEDQVKTLSIINYMV